MKSFKKTLSVILALLLLAVCAVPVFAADETATVSLRVEGIKENLYYGDVTVDAGSNVLQVLEAAAAEDDALTLTVITSEYGPYLAAINGVAAGSQTKTGWDGWQYHVDGKDPGVGVTAYTVSDGEEIVVFYGDEWGETGMYYPEIDLSQISKGLVTFTATATVYDENWNPSTETVALTGYTLYWDGAKISPDENGVCELPVSALRGDTHTVQIERYAENGLPDILRYAPDYAVKTNVSFFARIGLAFSRLFARHIGVSPLKYRRMRSGTRTDGSGLPCCACGPHN